MTTSKDNEWQRKSSDVFWGEIAPCDHVLQIYENDESFIDVLAGFVGGGINAGDSVIVIATENHLISLEKRLESFGIHIVPLVADLRYIPLSAEQTLEKFMVNGWPDEHLFLQTVSGILKKAKCKNRRVRAFGEMVALLWSKGLNGATVQLEHLWNRFREQEEFCLFCAYPRIGFTQSLPAAVQDICCTHSKLIDGATASMTEVVYLNN
jgi:hypothetical protein